MMQIIYGGKRTTAYELRLSKDWVDVHANKNKNNSLNYWTLTSGVKQIIAVAYLHAYQGSGIQDTTVMAEKRT
jgi:hypothetical protein